jgi:BTB/POZ domain
MSNESPPRKSSSRLSSASSRSASPESEVLNSKRKMNHGVPRHRQISVHNPSLSGGGTIDNSTVMPLNEFLYEKGFLEGTCSDVTIRAFGKEYHLHKLILCRSPYFSSLLSGFWGIQEKQYEDTDSPKLWVSSNSSSNGDRIEVHFEDSEFITDVAFELALSRLYGHEDTEAEAKHLKSMFAIANYLDLPDLEDSCAGLLIKSLSQETIVDMLQFSCTYDYGKSSFRITEACKSYLCVDGYLLPLALWEELPDKVVGEVVIHNGFFVRSEWERCHFIVNLYKYSSSRECPSESRLQVLQNALTHGVYYCNMHYDQLRTLEKLRTRDNKHLIKRGVLRDGLWLQSELRQRIESANSADVVLGFVEEGTEESEVGDDENEHHKEINGSDSNDQDIALADDETPYYYIPQGDENEDEKHNEITRHPPFRFAVHFDELYDLEEGKRIYSDTYWYAGSYWNVYIQKCRYKKGYQLGVYLHRSKTESAAEDNNNIFNFNGVRREWGRTLDDYLQIGTNDESHDEDLTVMTMENLSLTDVENTFRPLNTRQSSGWASRFGMQMQQQQQQHQQQQHQQQRHQPAQQQALFQPPQVDSQLPQQQPAQTTPFSFSLEPTNSNSLPPGLFGFSQSNTSLFPTPSDTSKKDPKKEKQKKSTEYNSAPFLDNRTEVGAYFEIYTPSRRGKTSLTCFSSAPDKFGFSQSWGWKSSSLWSFTEEKVLRGDESGLKFMIVVGVV